METEKVMISLTPALYRQFMRLKTQGAFLNDEDLMQASFEALEREWQRGIQSASPSSNSGSQPYMPFPGLSPDDYDT